MRMNFQSGKNQSTHRHHSRSMQSRRHKCWMAEYLLEKCRRWQRWHTHGKHFDEINKMEWIVQSVKDPSTHHCWHRQHPQMGNTLEEVHQGKRHRFPKKTWKKHLTAGKRW